MSTSVSEVVRKLWPSGKQLLAELEVIVDLAVEDDGEAAVRARHRLLAAANVDDRQAAMAEADLEASVGGVGERVAGAIRPAMGHRVGDAGKGLAVLAIGGTKGPTEDPAHPNSSPSYSTRHYTSRLPDTRAKGYCGHVPRLLATLRHPQGELGGRIRS